ncbi:hypothetical protein BABINDRAFT_160080 [Babjeviella inositovora NRRL Y-12698]|uniref:DUF202 domain-containing protein n=1 Tax=Babjeviella inositovora NRRL Y-12698 TaxID=984486 RepID=A0A1E3QW09_9ASCO|nr:uncharacterized protein BABINDRAFT_160080 [Babjeviella inositovora NRRL Y-12698]ODQ81849.1 hypothetical protein BABINDRAFT_160080 [Babjeviella inositovora NRRL Y-12698]
MATSSSVPVYGGHLDRDPPSPKTKPRSINSSAVLVQSLALPKNSSSAFRHDNSPSPHPRFPQPASLANESAPQEENTSEPTQYNIFDLKNYSSVLLENKSSVARDHMANERTFLAWLRTSLAFVSIGIGVTQLFRLSSQSSNTVTNEKLARILSSPSAGLLASFSTGKVLGTLFIGIGICSLLFGVVRYFEVQALLQKNYYPASRLGVLALIISVFCLITATFVTVVCSI